jgi:hypothetical protein
LRDIVWPVNKSLTKNSYKAARRRSLLREKRCKLRFRPNRCPLGKCKLLCTYLDRAKGTQVVVLALVHCLQSLYHNGANEHVKKKKKQYTCKNCYTYSNCSALRVLCPFATLRSVGKKVSDQICEVVTKERHVLPKQARTMGKVVKSESI